MRVRERERGKEKERERERQREKERERERTREDEKKKMSEKKVWIAIMGGKRETFCARKIRTFPNQVARSLPYL